jgi:hypothetical protein
LKNKPQIPVTGFKIAVENNNNRLRVMTLKTTCFLFVCGLFKEAASKNI